MLTTAFVGPVAITICTLAGVKFGYSLHWAVSLSLVATIVLREMAAKVAFF